MKTLVLAAAVLAFSTAAHASSEPRVLTLSGTDIGYVSGRTADGSFLFEPNANTGIGGVWPVVVPEQAFREDDNGNLVSALSTDRLGEIAFEQW